MPESVLPLSPPTGATIRKKRILLIDDIPGVRSALRAYLCPPPSAQERMQQIIKKGSIDVSPRYIIDEAGQGQLGVDMAKAQFDAATPYDVAFVDMMMPPGIDGVETVRRIRAFDAHIHIIICTAMHEASTQELATANGGVPPLLIHKPPSAADNLGAIVAGLKWREVVTSSSSPV